MGQQWDASWLGGSEARQQRPCKAVRCGDCFLRQRALMEYCWVGEGWNQYVFYVDYSGHMCMVGGVRERMRGWGLAGMKAR